LHDHCSNFETGFSSYVFAHLEGVLASINIKNLLVLTASALKGQVKLKMQRARTSSVHSTGTPGPKNQVPRGATVWTSSASAHTAKMCC